MSTLTSPTTRPRGAHRPAAPVHPAGRRVAAAVGGTAVNLLLVVALLALFGLAIGPRLLPYRTTTMLTGSMVPLIDPGDVAVITAEPVSAVQVGQVITMQAPTPDRRIVTHRVVEVVRGDDGSVSVRTKGDANEGVDPWLATLEGDTAWRYRGTIPHLGTAIRALRQPAVHPVLVLGVPALLVVWVLIGVWRPEEDR